MDRLTRDQHDASDALVRRMYHRTMSGWVTDLLQRRGHVAWAGHDVVADYRDHDWHRLYGGSILDD